MSWKDKLHIIIGCAVIVAATNLLTIPEAYASEEKIDQEYCIPLSVQIAEKEYIERLEKLIADLYLFKVQGNIDIAEAEYRERYSTKR